MTATVLIVDDSLTIRMNLMELLSDAKLPAVACSTVAEARQALANGTFSLVILDVLLPDGDGVEFLAELRDLPGTPSPVVLMLSTEAELRDRVRQVYRAPIPELVPGVDSQGVEGSLLHGPG